MDAARPVLQVASKVGKGVAAIPAVFVVDVGIAAREHDRLEQHAANLLDVRYRKAHDVADDVIVHAVHDGDLEVRLHAGARDVLECQLLHVEEIASAPMKVTLVRRAIQLEVDLMNAGGVSPCCEAVLLCKSDSVRDDADAVETDALRVAHGIQKIRSNGWFATSEQNVDVTLRLYRTSSIEDLSDVIHREFVDVRRVVGVHEAGGAFQIAAVRQIDN
jgi:hypothetical protein